MVTHRKPPRWIDEDKVIKFVRAEYEQIISSEEQAFADLPWETVPGTNPEELLVRMEQEAVSAAQRGDIRPLTGLLRSDHFMNQFDPAARRMLSPDTYDLAAEFVSGARNAKNGKLRGEGGAPRKSEDQRRAATPAHNAVEVLPLVQEILARHWPDQNVRDRAVKVAAQIAGAEENAVHSLVRRSGRDRHRL